MKVDFAKDLRKLLRELGLQNIITSMRQYQNKFNMKNEANQY